MVSTQSQYITDFTPKIMEPGKSPLALLAKTCETIGLPEAPAKKSPTSSGSGSDKKDDKVSHHHHHQKSKGSPRATPASKEPTLTFPGLPKPPAGFPMMPGMPFPFFNPMMPYPMPFAAFPGGFMGMPGRMPCPFAMMRQPCLTPGCVQCVPTSAAAGAGAVPAGFSPEMMAQFAAHPLFSAYAGMMPTTAAAGSPQIPNYQSLLAACASSATPTTSRSSPKATPAPSTPSSPKHRCNWMESNGVCGKKFNDEEELANHVKAIHTPSPPSSASSTSNQEGSMKTPTSRPTSSASVRFNPYGKPTSGTPAAGPAQPPATSMMMPMNPMMLPFPLQAMYTQRLMSSMPHP